MQRKYLWLLLGVILVLPSCAPGKLFGPTITLTPTSTQTFTPTFTSTSTPMPTPTPTSTLTPSQTNTPFGGGSGQFLLGWIHYDNIKNPSSSTSGIYRYNFLTHRTAPILDNYILQGVSPDGSKLLVSQSVNIFNPVGRLYIINLDGSNPILISMNFYDICGLCAYWFSDSGSIVFLAKNGPIIQLYMRQQDGSVEQITKSSYGVNSFLPVLNDGGIYWEEDDGYVTYGWRWTNIDSTETKKFQNWDDLAISPDGEYIAYDHRFQPIAGRGFLTESIISRTDGSNPIKLRISEMVKNPSPEFPLFVEGYIWFPDSQRILVQIALCSPVCDNFRYLVLSTSGELLANINMEAYDMGYGSWSPDGRQYAFIAQIKKGDSHIWSPKVLDIETMQIQDIDLNMPNDTFIPNIFWLP